MLVFMIFNMKRSNLFYLIGSIINIDAYIIVYWIIRNIVGGLVFQSLFPVSKGFKLLIIILGVLGYWIHLFFYKKIKDTKFEYDRYKYFKYEALFVVFFMVLLEYLNK